MALPIGANREAVIQLRQVNPCLKGSDIARTLGISRERVRQILNEEGMRTAFPQKEFICNQCGITFTTKGSSAKFCSMKCYSDSTRVPIICDECGILFHTLRSALIGRYRNRKTDGLYCSKRCWGKVFGRGRGSFGNFRRPDKQIDAHIRWLCLLNFTTSEIQAITGYSLYTIYKRLNAWGVGRAYGGKKGPRLGTPSRSGGRPISTGRMPIQYIRVRWLKRLNFSDAEIIRFTGCGKATIQRAIHGRN